MSHARYIDDQPQPHLYVVPSLDGFIRQVNAPHSAARLSAHLELYDQAGIDSNNLDDAPDNNNSTGTYTHCRVLTPRPSPPTSSRALSSPALLHFSHPRTVHRVLAAPHSPSFECHFRPPFPPQSPQESFPHHPRFVQSSPFYLALYGRLKDHLQRHLLGQVMVSTAPKEELETMLPIVTASSIDAASPRSGLRCLAAAASLATPPMNSMDSMPRAARHHSSPSDDKLAYPSPEASPTS
ncbi:hypothetical protein BOTBODRAFT_182236 [Botryobasidium botryosum FD-172 SS1]|uniref:Uncharacterized protein n=1 Tax=Botryobasidium botryosum (strain FD-172 SS1) TaxID=930990 RepID=A0A067LU65_BOTB1|nr:hypothetical protein BOTBODRAFT_182236 [Botryobasidium botryosum FD-172 SS1]